MVDVVGAVEPPMAFAMPNIAPLQPAARPDDPAADQPAEPPQDYRQSAQQPPLETLVPRVADTRDPNLPFASTQSISEWGRRGAEHDPHQPIVTSGGPSARATRPGRWAPPDSPQPGLPVLPDAVAGPPVRGLASLEPARPSALFGERPALPGDRTLGALCRGLGWGLVVSLVAGGLSTWVSVPALLAGWYFSWRHPVARGPLLKAYGAATALVLLVSLIGSPTRSGREQLGWTSWVADIGLLVVSMIIIDRALTPPPRNDPDRGGSRR